MSTLYQITSESPFFLAIERIENIEDATDEFFTDEELREMLGLGEHDWLNTHGITVKRNHVISILQPLITEMTEKGKKSIIIEDVELVTFLKEYDLPVSDFIDGLRRVGNRLSLYEKSARIKATKQHAQQLINVGISVVNEQAGCHMYMPYAHRNYGGVIKVIQKLLTWEDLLNYMDEKGKEYYEDTVCFMKQVWDEPDMFQKS